MPWITSVTDRTITDIETLTDKAFFNVVDWIRINTNTTYVRTLINVLRSLNVPYNTVVEPSIVTRPTMTELNQFIENIDILRVLSGLPVASGIVALRTNYSDTISAISPDYEDVNDWERDLQLIKDLTIAISTYIVFCGVSNIGQPRFWQARFRNMFVASVTNVRRLRVGVGQTGTGLMRQNNFRRYA